MKKETGFTLIEMLIVFIVIIIMATIVLPFTYKKSEEKRIQDLKNNKMSYVNYIRKCIDGHTYIVSANGDLRQLLSENKEPVFCEYKMTNENTIEVNANPYKNE